MPVAQLEKEQHDEAAQAEATHASGEPHHAGASAFVVDIAAVAGPAHQNLQARQSKRGASLARAASGMKNTIIFALAGALLGIVAAALIVPPALAWYSIARRPAARRERLRRSCRFPRSSGIRRPI